MAALEGGSRGFAFASGMAATSTLLELLDSGDHVIAMDSLIYYTQSDIRAALANLGERTRGSVVFTVAPRTPLLMTMWYAGKAFPRSDRSPVMIPHGPGRLGKTVSDIGQLTDLGRVNSGFYISQALEFRP